MKNFFKKLLSYLLQGLLYIAPVSITAWIIYKLFIFFDSIFELEIPGLGLLIILVVLTLTGFIGSTIIFQPIKSWLTGMLGRIPFVKLIYSSIKDFTAALVGQKKKFTEPVLVKMSNDSAIEKIGFITKRDLSCIGIGPSKVAVYFPHSYAFSGNLFIVPVENITPIDASPSEVIKFIVSGGVTEIDASCDKENTISSKV